MRKRKMVHAIPHSSIFPTFLRQANLLIFRIEKIGLPRMQYLISDTQVFFTKKHYICINNTKTNVF
ncbi:MAG: hypothetical protein DWQ02_24025 [Bacteroidetes bacterium]|nr:MAG: hypothetical protein DWQ02_24025 [Bacteroidota bacterium]